ncbi:hypothetical protein DL93DRAFT_1116595 [Clavulina sp. PMI_390]|nr:hypothetical protein DL93DRAFT_1116595 [Clavulina sp. PMI_390]
MYVHQCVASSIFFTFLAQLPNLHLTRLTHANTNEHPRPANNTMSHRKNSPPSKALTSFHHRDHKRRIAPFLINTYNIMAAELEVVSWNSRYTGAPTCLARFMRKMIVDPHEI